MHDAPSVDSGAPARVWVAAATQVAPQGTDRTPGLPNLMDGAANLKKHLSFLSR